MSRLKDFICELFSINCNLTSLDLDIADSNCSDNVNIHQYFLFSSSTINNKLTDYCSNLRYLHIHLIYGYIVEHIILRTPVLEVLQIRFQNTLIKQSSYDVKAKKFAPDFVNWFDKIPKLKSFTIKTNIFDNSELKYLKWILNNVNYIEKLKIHLDIKTFMWSNCIIDGNIFHEYFLPDTSNNLIDFDFYIASKCKELLPFDIPTIINSFKTHQFFVNHHWIDVQCFYDPIMSYQHLSSTKIIKPTFYPGIIDFPSIFHWKNVRYIKVDLNPSIYFCLKQLDVIFPHLNCIQFNIGQHKPMTDLDYSTFLQPSMDVGHCIWTDIHLQYVTRLEFGFCFFRGGATRDTYGESVSRAAVLAYLISMPIQLIYLRIEQFEWLLHLITYASNKLRKNALSTIRHAEFCLLSCNVGPNESVCIGKNLVPFLNKYMPYLQTLRLWRCDDFPWTSIRPDYRAGYYCHIMSRRWVKSLSTSESIEQHVNVFEQNLCQLIKKLKEFVYLDIYGQICTEKIEPYRSMIQRRFPNSRVFIEISRLRLWF